MKRIFSSFLIAAIAIATPAQAWEVKPGASLAVQYRQGAYWPLLDGFGRVSLDDKNQIIMGEELNSDFSLELAELSLDARLNDFFGGRVSATVLRQGIGDQAPDRMDWRAISEWQTYGEQRQRGLTTAWYRWGLLQDAYLFAETPEEYGTGSFGQQAVPFGLGEYLTLEPPSIMQPRWTPMAEYITFNRLPAGSAPFLNSPVMLARDVGIVGTGKYQFVRVKTGLFNGAGPSRNDDNSAKDFVTQLSVFSEDDEIGFSYWKSPIQLSRLPYSPASSLITADRSRMALHANVTWDILRLYGQFGWGNEAGSDGVNIAQNGWFLNASGLLTPGTTLLAQYEAYDDLNPLRQLTSSDRYSLQRATLGIRQELMPGWLVQSDYAYTWETLSGADTFRANYGNFTVRTTATF